MSRLARSTLTSPSTIMVKGTVSPDIGSYCMVSKIYSILSVRPLIVFYFVVPEKEKKLPASLKTLPKFC